MPEGIDCGHFERHIREAIELNRRRAPLYAETSAGVSLVISRRLIRRERFILPLARWLDRRAEPYERMGIPIMGEIFVDMASAPAYSSRQSFPPPHLSSPLPAALARRLRRTYSAEGFPGTTRMLHAEVERLDADRGYWCMTRHLLESARRVCSCAERHRLAAAGAGMPSPEWMHRLLLRLHLAALGDAARLDTRALPLQRDGIPILCRDLPPIPPHPWVACKGQQLRA